MLLLKDAAYNINEIKDDVESALRFFFESNIYDIKFLSLKNFNIDIDKNRGQANAINIIKIIDNLNEIVQEEDDYILYLVDADIYIPGMNFIFALADPPRKRVVLSLYRLKRDYYGHSMVSIDRFKERVFKEILHEFGHIFGLRHCNNPECVMSFSNTLVDLDRKLPMFCRNCLLELKNQLGFDFPT